MDHDQDAIPNVQRRVDALHKRVDEHDRSIVRVETQIQSLDRRFDGQALTLAEMRASQLVQAQAAARTHEAIEWIKDKLTDRVEASERRASDATGRGTLGLAAGVVSLLTIMATTVYEILTR